MASVAPSDTESNASGFIRYGNKQNLNYLYTSLSQKMHIINQDILAIEKNLTNIITQSGPLENQLSVLLKNLPRPAENIHVEMGMETE